MKRAGCIVSALAIIGLILFVLLPALTVPKASSVIGSDINKLKQIGMACLMYEMDHAGHYPDSFADLTEYADAPKLYVAHPDRDKVGAMSNVMEWTSFVFCSGITTASPPSSVLAFLPPGHHKKHNGGVILFADGEVKLFDLPEFTRTLNRNPYKSTQVTSQ